MADKSSLDIPSATATETTSSKKYKGVRKRKWGKWVTEIRLPNSRDRIWLGSFEAPEKAARAFDAAQFCLRGPSANLNFPNSPPDIPGGRSMTPAEIQAAATRYANEEPTRRREDQAEVEVEEESDQAMRVELDEFTEFGSGSFSEFGLYSGFDEFTGGEYYLPPPANFEYGGGDHNNYEATFYQDSYLWNF